MHFNIDLIRTEKVEWIFYKKLKEEKFRCKQSGKNIYYINQTAYSSQYGDVFSKFIGFKYNIFGEELLETVSFRVRV